LNSIHNSKKKKNVKKISSSAEEMQYSFETECC